MRRGAILGAVALTLWSAVAVAVPKHSGGVGPYRTTKASTSGRGVTVMANGDVVVVGYDMNGPCAMAGPIITRLNPTLASVLWEKSFNPVSCNQSEVRGVVASGDLALVYGRYSSFGGFISAVDKDGGVVWTQQEPSLNGGMYDAEIDPVDGSLWAVGNSGGAPGTGYLFHYRVTAGGLDARVVESFTWNAGNELQAYGVAVTADAVFLGGRVYEMTIPGQRSWLARKVKGAVGLAWQRAGSESSGESAIWSLAARGDQLFSEYANAPGGGPGPYTLSMVRHNAATGAFEQSAPLANLNSPMSFDYRGHLAIHPTLPLLAFAAGTGVKVVDFGLNNVSSIYPVSNNNPYDADGAVFSDSMNFKMYTAATANVAALQFMEVEGFSFADADRKEEKNFLVAPNVLVLGDALGFVRLDVVKLKAGDAVTFTVFDAAGRQLIQKQVVADVSGEAQWVWDGTLEDGQQRINPGGYIVRADNGNSIVGRANFIAVQKRGGK